MWGWGRGRREGQRWREGRGGNEWRGGRLTDNDKIY
jgi:hypothetical protein